MTSTLLEYLDKAAPDRLAVRDADVGLTYGELRNRAQRIAEALHREHGGRKYVLLRATPDAAFVTLMLGVMYSGNTPIPVDPELPEQGLKYIRKKSRAVALLESKDARRLAAADPADHRDDSIPAIVLFTSGTSGYPKGVLISHGNVLHACEAISNYLEYAKYPSAAVALPLHYSYALLSQVCCMLYCGGHVRLFAGLRNPLKFARVVTEEGLETFCGVPSTYHALSIFHQLSPLHLPSVRVICSAGAAMDRSKYETIKQIFPNATFFDNYGMTEAAPRISFVREDDPRFHEPTCGRPIDGVEILIVDSETYEPIPSGRPGMLVVRGPNITSGYLNDPDLTRAAFTRDGYLISGDIATIDNGYIFIHGRQDGVFNIGGEKVAPLEIEHVLNRHAHVELSGIVGVEDQNRGKVPVAFLKLNTNVTRRDLIKHLERWLPKIKIPPRYFEVNSFPMTANGKMQRRKLSPDDKTRVLREIT